MRFVKPILAFASALTLILVTSSILLSPVLRKVARKGNVSRRFAKLWGSFFDISLENIPFEGARKLGESVREKALYAVLKNANYKYIIGVCAVIRSEEGSKYLLLHHVYSIGDPGQVWGLPGGGVFSYGIQHALAQEIRQELNIDISVGQLLAIDETEPPRLDFYFECTILQNQELQPRDEVDEAHYFSLDNLPPGISERHLRVLKAIAPLVGDPETEIFLPAQLPPLIPSYPPGLKLHRPRVHLFSDPNNNGKHNGNGHLSPGIPGAHNGTSNDKGLDNHETAVNNSSYVIYMPRGEREGPTDQTVYFDLGRKLELKDLPEIGPCSVCGRPMQKEYLEFERRRGLLTVVCDTPVPGYGCTGCGTKVSDPRITAELYATAARMAGEAGFIKEAEHFAREASQIHGNSGVSLIDAS